MFQVNIHASTFRVKSVRKDIDPGYRQSQDQANQQQPKEERSNASTEDVEVTIKEPQNKQTNTENKNTPPSKDNSQIKKEINITNKETNRPNPPENKTYAKL
jgi:hypothetical protein